MLADDNRITSSSNVEPLTSDHMPSNTAFIRPLPTTTNSKTMSDHDSSRSDLIVHAQQNIRPHNGAISVPPMKPYQPYNNTFDRPTYLPQFGISSYPDYMSHNPSFGSSRIPNYSEAYSQTFSSNPFTSNITSNLPSVGGNYWSDARSTHSFSDPYQHYNYNKLNATYDSLNKTALLRNNAYQDSISRQAFDSSISSYYRSPHDNLQGIFITKNIFELGRSLLRAYFAQ
ncbi:hypothetical protein DPMN_007383 [Dreissena polymorpha]|uniref:Uncharacterized protein n=1 Tax=Dreissena polymorpha TaxID=45954 RepID=A0A9D4MTK3_DREPO|nr:hypothetical protein DPMN_007383 [Dreissena polymorpha]